MNIVVLAGGTSTEREISIVSGTGICGALRQKGHRAILVDVFCGLADPGVSHFPETYDIDAAAAYIRSFDARIKEMEAERKGFFGPHVLELCDEAEIVFLALHGSNGEDGRVQAVFDLMGIRYTGTGYFSSAIAMDKGISKRLFLSSHLPVPVGFTMRQDNYDTDLRKRGLELPVVVKTCCGGSSVGVYIVHTQEEYEEALEKAFQYEREVVVEEYISGREFSVAVVDDVAYPVIEIRPLKGFYDYQNKYQPGSTIETCPADLSPELTQKMQDYAVAGARALGLQSYSRLDFLMDEKGDMYCLEANTLPGMTPTSLIPQEAKVLGMDYPELCEELIRVSLKKYQ